MAAAQFRVHHAACQFQGISPFMHFSLSVSLSGCLAGREVRWQAWCSPASLQEKSAGISGITWVGTCRCCRRCWDAALMMSTWCCITSPTSSPPCGQVGVCDGGLLDSYVFVGVVLFSIALYFLSCVLRERRGSKCRVIFCLCLQPLVSLVKHSERGMGNMCVV